MLWVQRLFRFAGVYGLLVLVPQYFMERRIGINHPPDITHPEFFYGFLGVALAWQVAFLIIATDPARYRLLIIPSAIEKFSFAVAAALLFAWGRVPALVCAFATVDLVLGGLFLVAFVQLERSPIVRREFD